MLGRRLISIACLMTWPMQMDFVMKISVFSSWTRWSLLNLCWATDSFSGCLKCMCQHMPVVVLLPSANAQTQYVKYGPGYNHRGCNKHLVSSVPVLQKAANTRDPSWWQSQTMMLCLDRNLLMQLWIKTYSFSHTFLPRCRDCIWSVPTTWPLPLLHYHTRYISYFASSCDYVNAILYS
jgi:hypothetical protein